MTTTLNIAGLAITATAQNVTAEQAEKIEAEITRYAQWAEKSAAKRGLAPWRVVKDHLDAMVGFGNTVHGAKVALSYRNA